MTFFAEIAEAPPGAEPFRVTAEPGVEVRACLWRGGTRGTVLLLTGRSEYIEKYGPVVTALAARGFSVLSLDWRGQGLSTRPAGPPMLGHVEDFADYQRDLAAVLTHPAVSDLPGPRLMLAHSMGGCIGFAALQQGFEVAAAVFSAPFWGIHLSPPMRPIVPAVAVLGRAIFGGRAFAPGGSEETYVVGQAFEGNTLTSDEAAYARMQAQARAHPELTLGGPSYGWLRAALAAHRAIQRAPPPGVAMLTLLGGDEAIVSGDAIRAQAARSPSTTLATFEGARHELLMEAPEIAERVWGAIDGFLADQVG
ncbi:MAG: alpha/beta hydrolase [Pseudomonadota bacterium]